MRKNENGRSMIEMLGVLAIIGVLSVGGIYGYTVAMRKYKANEIAQTLSMLATLAKSANAGAGKSLAIGASGLDTTPAGETVTAEADGTATPVVVKVTAPALDGDLGKAVCAIVPKTSGAGTTAGYYVCGCTGGDGCPAAGG